MTDVDCEWENFLNNNNNETENEYSNDNVKENISESEFVQNMSDIPNCGDLYISTKTKIAYFNTQIDLCNIFWNLKVQDYHVPKEGIIKKQMKFSSSTPEELEHIKNLLKKEKIIDEHIITQIIRKNIMLITFGL